MDPTLSGDHHHCTPLNFLQKGTPHDYRHKHPGSPETDNHEQFMRRIFPRMGRVRTAAQVVAMIKAGAGQ